MTDLPFYTKTAIADPDAPTHVLRPTAAGELPITGSVTLDVSSIEIGEIVIKDATSSNTASVSAAGLLGVDGSGVTQPVSAAALPLPSGAASASNQTAIISSLGNIDSALSGIALAAKQDTGNSTLAAIEATLTTGPLVLPLGAAQDSSLASIVTVLGAPLQTGGAVTANAGANLNTSLLALESGGHLASIDLKNPVLGAAVIAASIPVNIASDQTVAVRAAALPLAPNAAMEAGGNLALIAAELSQPLAADTNVAESLAKIVDLLSFISYQLGELPLNLTLSLNKGVVIANGDSFAAFQQSTSTSAGKLN